MSDNLASGLPSAAAIAEEIERKKRQNRERYAAMTPEQRQAYCAKKSEAWRSMPPEKRAEYNAKRRARRAGQPRQTKLMVSRAEVDAVRAAQGGTCPLWRRSGIRLTPKIVFGALRLLCRACSERPTL